VLSRKRSEELTHTEPGTPGGELLRRYWQPVALADEVSTRDPIPLKILHEDLVLFRNETDGALGLMARNCCHRGMDLSLGRLEDGGLRCIYHGWLYAPSGQCLEQPGEPEGSQLYKKIRQPAYPVREAGGLVFAYFGPGTPPLFPDLEILAVPPEHRFQMKVFQECNYLQALEGNLDPTHQSFLHAFHGGPDGAPRYGMREPVGGTQATNLTLYARNSRPAIDQENTAYGVRALISRPLPGEGTFLRIYNFALPNYAIVPGNAGADGYSVNWHVPIDDVTHWRFTGFFNRSTPIDRESVERRLPEMESTFRPKRNRSNRFLQDRASLGKTGWFSGLGPVFVDHDNCATSMQGPIQDRSAEHLGESDQMITRMRKLMFDALGDIRNRKDPRGVIRDAAGNWGRDVRVVSEFFPESENWREAWITRAEDRLRATALSR
jgi:phthalate 4,5-dioxygenase